MKDYYETAEEAAERLGKDPSYIRRMCKQGRVPGAVKFGDSEKSPWLIPEGAEILRVYEAPNPEFVRSQFRKHWHKYYSPSATSTQ